ncbi:hypothetical protein CRYUN_Cryun07bG0075500 [Craigia yunnanensis]
MQLMGQKFCDHKGTLKLKYIKDCNTHEGMIKNCPKNIRMKEWVPFVNHTLTTKAKVAKDPKGREPSQWKMFCLTHKRKDGSIISVATQQVVDEFETLSRSELESSELIDKDEIYHQVVGNERHGRVRRYGLGPTPTSIFGANPCLLELLGKLTKANKLNEKMLTKVEELEKNR